MSLPKHSLAAVPGRSREEIAKDEIGRTDSTPSVNRFLTLAFVTVILAVPVIQTLHEAPGLPQWCDVFRFVWPEPDEIQAIVRADGLAGSLQAGKAVNSRLLHDIANHESELKDQDAMIQWLIPRMQTVITGWLRGGNEDAYCGREGWLFYRRDIELLTGRGFLDPEVLRRRAAGGSELKAPPQPDPLEAIIAFRDQLLERGIELIVMPAPVKPSIYPEFQSRRYLGRRLVVRNPSCHEFESRLAEAGVRVFDPARMLAEAKDGSPEGGLYLKTDTHWTPSAMEMTAARLAEFARQAVTLPAPQPDRFTTLEQTIESRGDIALMLRLPEGQEFFPRENVRIRQVLDGKSFWRPAPDAEVLVLGDSFANIYSLEPMGWGEAAGLVEHLSLALGLPVDAITRNDAGSHATREMLAGELQRGHDRLAGKKLLIWEFAARELASGDWKRLSMNLGEKPDAGMYVPAAGRTVEIRGVVRAVSPAPRPGSVPYKDHIVMLHLAELQSPDDAAAAGKEAVVFVWSMRDNVATAASRYRSGDAVRLHLRPWTDVSRKYGAINRSELEGDEYLLADPAWGE